MLLHRNGWLVDSHPMCCAMQAQCRGYTIGCDNTWHDKSICNAMQCARPARRCYGNDPRSHRDVTRFEAKKTTQQRQTARCKGKRSTCCHAAPPIRPGRPAASLSYRSGEAVFHRCCPAMLFGWHLDHVGFKVCRWALIGPHVRVVPVSAHGTVILCERSAKEYSKMPLTGMTDIDRARLLLHPATGVRDIQSLLCFPCGGVGQMTLLDRVRRSREVRRLFIGLTR